jgi:hypothetical protein
MGIIIIFSSKTASAASQLAQNWQHERLFCVDRCSFRRTHEVDSNCSSLAVEEREDARGASMPIDWSYASGI